MGIGKMQQQVPTDEFTKMRERLLGAYPDVQEWDPHVCPNLPPPACKGASCGSLVATLREAYPDNANRGVIMVEQDPFPLLVVGDLHGDLHALLDILDKWIEQGWMDQTMKLLGEESVLFTGDLVDRGCYGPYVMFIVLHLKKLNPGKVWWTLGNHDNSVLQWSVPNHNFSGQLEKFSGEDQEELARQLTRRVPTGIVFMPDSLRVIFACHGMPDISPKIDRSMYRALLQYQDLFPHYIESDMNQWQWGRCMTAAYTASGREYVPHHWWTSHTGPEDILVLRGHDHKSSPWEQCVHKNRPHHQRGTKRNSGAQAPSITKRARGGGGSGRLHIFTHTGSPRLLRTGDGFGFTHYSSDGEITIYTCTDSVWTAKNTYPHTVMTGGH